MATKWDGEFAKGIKRYISNSPILNYVFSQLNLGNINLATFSPILFLFV